MTDPLPRPRLQIDWKRALIPISLGSFFVLYFYFQVPLPVLAVLSLWIPLYYLVLPWFAWRRWEAFEREFAYRFPRGDFQGLLAFWQAQRFLRLFGPEAQMLGKLGLIYLGLNRMREAEIVLERALLATHPTGRQRVMLNLAHARFKLGKLDEAAQLYRLVLRTTPHNATATTRLALIDIHKGRSIEEARKTLEDARATATGDDRTLIEEALASSARG